MRQSCVEYKGVVLAVLAKCLFNGGRMKAYLQWETWIRVFLSVNMRISLFAKSTLWILRLGPALKINMANEELAVNSLQRENCLCCEVFNVCESHKCLWTRVIGRWEGTSYTEGELNTYFPWSYKHYASFVQQQSPQKSHLHMLCFYVHFWAITDTFFLPVKF